MPPAQIRNKKRHPFAVTEDYLTKKLGSVRDQCGAYDHIEQGLQPSLHDVRGLGAWLYKQAGFDKKYFQLLTGHASEKMLQVYLDGHEAPKPILVNAGLSIELDERQ